LAKFLVLVFASFDCSSVSIKTGITKVSWLKQMTAATVEQLNSLNIWTVEGKI